jgi:hypothetical protein
MLLAIPPPERNISLVNIVRLAAALNLDPGELLRGLRS